MPRRLVQTCQCGMNTPADVASMWSLHLFPMCGLSLQPFLPQGGVRVDATRPQIHRCIPLRYAAQMFCNRCGCPPQLCAGLLFMRFYLRDVLVSRAYDMSVTCAEFYFSWFPQTSGGWLGDGLNDQPRRWKRCVHQQTLLFAFNCIAHAPRLRGCASSSALMDVTLCFGPMSFMWMEGGAFGLGFSMGGCHSWMAPVM